MPPGPRAPVSPLPDEWPGVHLSRPGLGYGQHSRRAPLPDERVRLRRHLPSGRSRRQLSGLAVWAAQAQPRWIQRTPRRVLGVEQRHGPFHAPHVQVRRPIALQVQGTCGAKGRRGVPCEVLVACAVPAQGVGVVAGNGGEVGAGPGAAASVTRRMIGCEWGVAGAGSPPFTRGTCSGWTCRRGGATVTQGPRPWSARTDATLRPMMPALGGSRGGVS